MPRLSELLPQVNVLHQKNFSAVTTKTANDVGFSPKVKLLQQALRARLGLREHIITRTSKQRHPETSLITTPTTSDIQLDYQRDR